MHQLQREIERLYAMPNIPQEDLAVFEKFVRFRDALTTGEIRAAEKIAGKWQTNAWVKQGILLGFRIGKLVDSGDPKVLTFVDKGTYPARRFAAREQIRVIPGGSSVRTGAYVAASVVCMPPMFINVGAYVDEGTMVDSHALVGSCAQVGKRVHISAAAQIGGVLEPINATPVIVEDEVLGRRQLRDLRRDTGRRASGTGSGRDPDAVHAAVRYREGRDLSRYRNGSAARAGGRGRGARFARDHEREGCGMGIVAVCAGDREVSRRADRSRRGVGGPAAIVIPALV